MPSRRLLLGLAVAAVTAGMAPGAAGAARAARPAVTGTAVVGHTLHARLGRWGRGARRVHFAWLSCNRRGRACAARGGAHARRYRLQTRDTGRRMRVRVRARTRVSRHGRAAWRRVRATSAATAPVRARTVTPGPGPGPAPAPPGPPSGPGAGPPGPGLHVSGNRLLGADGAVVHLHGVNFPGTEYACIQGWGIFDGPSDDASVAAIASWHANVVHLGLNEDCVLAINGVPAQLGGARYMSAIKAYVDRLHAHGLYAEVALFWDAPGTQPAQGHGPVLDADHSAAALRAIANTFKDDPLTIIGLDSEPHDISWACWANGGAACSVGYAALGMKDALAAVRGTGATNVVAIPGIDYANNLSQWLRYAPVADGRLVAEQHVYGGNECASTSCFDAQVAPVAQHVPVLWGETGEHYDGGQCGSAVTSRLIAWADAHGIGYEFWHWNSWGDCLDLISDPDGTVADSDYARYVHDHLAALAR